MGWYQTGREVRDRRRRASGHRGLEGAPSMIFLQLRGRCSAPSITENDLYGSQMGLFESGRPASGTSGCDCCQVSVNRLGSPSADQFRVTRGRAV